MNAYRNRVYCLVLVALYMTMQEEATINSSPFIFFKQKKKEN